jgi:tungstate transport system substrate-binding protein
MYKRFFTIWFILLLTFSILSIALGQEHIKMATTTSTDNSGLLDVLLPPFEQKFNIKVDVIAVGTGKALKLGENGDVDIVFVHAREAEDKFVNDGYGINRRDVMYNDFIIIGPKEDPAGIKGMEDAVMALKQIASKEASFISRGDDSGTDKKEKFLWKAAGIVPKGSWYMETGQGMGPTLQIADEKRGYTLADRGTYLAYKGKIDLPILVEGDERLFNPYGIIAVNPAKHPHVKYDYAMALIGWVTSVDGQKIIGDYKKYGESLFYPTALKIAGDEYEAIYGNGSHKIILATGSPGELGLLESLANAFNPKHDTAICWKKAGSGESLQLLKDKKVDIIMVHAPEAEKSAVQEGWAINRTLIGSNEFYIVGPKDDPAKIADSKSAAEAYSKIAKTQSKFLSRGDNSGTNKKELDIWKKAGIQPSGDWYIVTKDFMMATLKKADREKGYFMLDSSTWVTAKNDIQNLKILFKGDPVLINTYHALCQPDGATAGQPYAAEFIKFLSSEEGQNIIRNYGKDAYGEALYNDAQYAKQYDH